MEACGSLVFLMYILNQDKKIKTIHAMDDNAQTFLWKLQLFVEVLK